MRLDTGRQHRAAHVQPGVCGYLGWDGAREAGNLFAAAPTLGKHGSKTVGAAGSQDCDIVTSATSRSPYSGVKAFVVYRPLSALLAKLVSCAAPALADGHGVGVGPPGV
jgi:hypothetical protein